MRINAPRLDRGSLILAPLVALAGFLGSDAVGGGEPQEVELAGHSLTVSPSFNYVAAFNRNEQVDGAINPKVFPSILGQTCDVYVVDQKSKEEWLNNPQLNDVRVGQCPAGPAFCESGPFSEPPCRCKFNQESLEDSSFVLATANQLSSDEGPCYSVMGQTICTGLGKGYDVVLDCAAAGEPNGKLSPEDFIDGVGDEAGFYVVHDTTAERLPTSSVDYCIVQGCSTSSPNPYQIPAGFMRELTYFPTNIKDMAPAPLVVIGHGNGHMYNWYTYLQRHLASYGYVVMSHQNETGPGSPAAANTMLRHTDALIAASLGPDCAAIHPDLCGAIDPSRIVWIGHSRGGEGAVMAYNQVLRGNYVPQNYSLASIKLVSSMAGPDNHGGDPSVRAVPGALPFHLIWGAADNDVKGTPGSGSAFHILERGTGPRQSVYIHGVGHAWFHERAVDAPCLNCCPTNPPNPSTCCNNACCLGTCPVLYGPSPITEAETHRIVRGYYVPLLKRYLEKNVPATDFFWRPWQSFRPQGANPFTAVALEYEDGGDLDRFIVDDYQSNPSPTQSSSGGDVSFNVGAILEDVTRDQDCTFEWDPTGLPSRCPLACEATAQFQQPFNGMTRARPDETHRAVVFEWPVAGISPPYSYVLDVIPEGQYLKGKQYLSFRAAQMSRHPRTQEQIGDLDLSVTLKDVHGVTATVRLSKIESGIVEPYARKDSPRDTVAGCLHVNNPRVCACASNEQPQCFGCNPFYPGQGWQVSYETVRVRLVDFQNTEPGLDLLAIAEIAFQFGSGAGSSAGRLALDDIEFTSR